MKPTSSTFSFSSLFAFFFFFFLACVILEKLTELGDQSQKVTGKSVIFFMFRKGEELLFLPLTTCPVFSSNTRAGIKGVGRGGQEGAVGGREDLLLS